MNVVQGGQGLIVSSFGTPAHPDGMPVAVLTWVLPVPQAPQAEYVNVSQVGDAAAALTEAALTLEKIRAANKAAEIFNPALAILFRNNVY